MDWLKGLGGWIKDIPKWLIVVVTLSLVIFTSIKNGAQVPSILEDTSIAEVLRSAENKSVVLNLIFSIWAATIFYIVVDFAPRQKARKKTKETLDTLIASMIYSLREDLSTKEQQLHRASVLYADINVLQNETFQKLEDRLTKPKDKALRRAISLTWLESTIEERESHLRGVIPLAASLSSKHLLLWLDIIEETTRLGREFKLLRNGLDDDNEGNTIYGADPECEDALEGNISWLELLAKELLITINNWNNSEASLPIKQNGEEGQNKSNNEAETEANGQTNTV